MNFTLYTADCAGNATNCLYPHESGITCPEELAAAVSRDHVFAGYRDGYRLAGNFLRSDVIPMDCDNGHSENPNDWLTAEKLADIFAGTDMVIYPSRHHMLPKGGRAARPKYHVLFPIREREDAGEYAALKAAIQKRYGFFDGNALDAARFFFGSACEPADITRR